MIVRMRSCAQAAKVAEATGGVQLAGKPKPDGTPTFSRYVEIGVDFEAHRPGVESVSVLFELYDGDANSYAATGGPGAQLPSGWMVTAAKFEVEWPADPQRAGLVRSHFGARRKAFNWGLAQVKADLDAKAADPAHESVDWDLKSLRWAWNRAKDGVAPWWALTQPTVRAGMDLGVRTLATVATLDTVTGEQTIIEYPNPAPLKATLVARRRAGRELSRRIPASHGHRAAKAKLARLDRRCVHLRREAAHQLTTELAGTYGQVVIEDLDVAAMKRSMRRRAFRRSVSDAAMGLVAPQLAYKTAKCSGVLTVADRWFASSQIHHGCTSPDGTPCRLQGKGRIDKHLLCPVTGEVVDRDRNAALNLRDWPDNASCGPVGTTAPSAPGPTTTVGTGHGADTGSSGAGGASVRPRPLRARRGEAKTQTPQGDAA
ncbi:transposase [Mycobacterium canetti]|uniref:transposase n=1 Tax=Mycobacterium canetti TaxID=78331 RepID=UPI0002A59F77|nr:transposase [Mycobacterium canetti]MBC9074859.1 transposase [Mycobacterium canetti]CCK54872.1 Putative transposase [Mycobacterium canettii CIPT 140070008]